MYILEQFQKTWWGNYSALTADPWESQILLHWRQRMSNWSSSPRLLVVGLYFFFASIKNNSVPRSAIIMDALGSLRLCGLWGDPWLTPCTPEEFPRSNRACFVSQSPLIKAVRTLGAMLSVSQHVVTCVWTTWYAVSRANAWCTPRPPILNLNLGMVTRNLLLGFFFCLFFNKF